MKISDALKHLICTVLAARSSQDCYSKTDEIVIAQFKNRFGYEKNVKATKYISTVG
jgi:hypothetical protein